MNSSMGHMVYLKFMLKDQYIHGESAHYLAQKWAVLCTLIHHTKTIGVADSLEEEMWHLK